MAWPKSPLTTYAFDAAPPIKSFDLNQIQDAINRIINGTYSLLAVTVDGVGGNIVVPVPGTITSSGGITAGGTSVFGDIVAINAPQAWVQLQFDGAGLLSSFAKYRCSASYTSPVGTTVKITYDTPIGTNNYCIFATPENAYAGCTVISKTVNDCTIQFFNPSTLAPLTLFNNGLSIFVMGDH